MKDNKRVSQVYRLLAFNAFDVLEKQIYLILPFCRCILTTLEGSVIRLKEH